jgi:hypothetical protein
MAPKVSALVQEYSPLDNMLRTGVTVLILGYVLLESTVFHTQYSKRLVELYSHPWWRLALVSLVGLGAWWCPRVGLALALAVYFYLNDMQILTSPFK